jgi:predicted RNA polymerase sigma factor
VIAERLACRFWLPSVRGDLLMKTGRYNEARIEFERAAELTQNAQERAFLTARAKEVLDRLAGHP